MGQDCPSVCLYMMHSNNNNIYTYKYIDDDIKWKCILLVSVGLAQAHPNKHMVAAYSNLCN